MIPSWRVFCKTLPLLLGLGLLLSACSRVELIYRNLDWLLPWRLEHYLDLDRQQRAWLEPRLRAHLDWHCSRELPRNLAWLQRSRELVEQPQVSAAQLVEHLAEVDAALQRIAVQVTPTAIDLLRSLGAEQVAELESVLRADYHDDRRSFLDPPLARQIDERAARLERRLQPWFGRLNAAQRRHLALWSQALGEQNRLWLSNRLRWQSELLAALAARDSAAFPARLTRLLQARESFHDAEYRDAYSRARQAAAELLSQLLGSADVRQRRRLSQRLAQLSRDLAEQLCAASPARA
ncbi:hypothetical protein I0D00_06220 [Pseudomonas lalucatii]|uniref:Lipoprotein n=1 Tax=Pseudomonas lalucatii TaxID=1424203 RepID=A0ABS5PYG2_9PSED|nr:DUF6279 family lipoprotein [Pseudomonas lalucatii]MBS7661547.1 hypothetical protein [Pseudomonas lalucatii]MBS7691865.1 hypothetical protein [Pseudomonas lalucatii]MBS7724025.1 hypothetical protein [Pseudomonas lalucatii]QVM87973.1 hypothetical protein I0D68_03225 [Pseudomonas lalucatii]